MKLWKKVCQVQNFFLTPTRFFEAFQLLKLESERSNYASS